MTIPHCFSCLGCEALKNGGSTRTQTAGTSQPGSCIGCLNHQRLQHNAEQPAQPPAPNHKPKTKEQRT